MYRRNDDRKLDNKVEKFVHEFHSLLFQNVVQSHLWAPTAQTYKNIAE